MNDLNSLSVVLPAYNEEKNIRQTVGDSLDFLKGQDFFKEFEIIVVNDGSTDQTASIVQKLADSYTQVVAVTNSKNLGYGGALTSGIKAARFSWLLLMDADGQFKISSINDAKNYFAKFDIIIGYRCRRADNFFRDFLGKTYTFLIDRFFGLRLKDINCGFKLFKRDALHLTDAHFHAGVFYTDILIKTKAKGYKLKEFPVEHFPRMNGSQTGANVNVIFRAVMDLIRLFARRQ